MTEWFEEWFGDEYLQLYPHRDAAEAARAIALITTHVGFAPDWQVLDVACGAGRHAAAFERAGARCTGVDLSAALLRAASGVTRAPLVRADMRALPIRRGSMDLTVNLFTSFGYFATDAEHVAALHEMVETVRAGGWFVLDFLNAAAVRAQLVPRETRQLGGIEVTVERSVSADGRHVRKTVRAPGRQAITERVRLFGLEEIAGMLTDSGVRLRHRFGDYDGSSLHPDAPRTILLGQTG